MAGGTYTPKQIALVGESGPELVPPPRKPNSGMPHTRKAWKRLKTNFRLLIAETFIRWAVNVAPKGHPDTLTILQAAHHVFTRNAKD